MFASSIRSSVASSATNEVDSTDLFALRFAVFCHAQELLITTTGNRAGDWFKAMRRFRIGNRCAPESTGTRAAQPFGPCSGRPFNGLADGTNEIILGRLPNADGSDGQPSGNRSGRDPVGLRPVRVTSVMADRTARPGENRNEDEAAAGPTADRAKSRRRVLRHAASQGRSNRGDVKRGRGCASSSSSTFCVQPRRSPRRRKRSSTFARTPRSPPR